MRGKREKIRLDAVVVSMIDSRVFEVGLENGHRFSAVTIGENRGGARCRPGARVRVILSPCDMSRGAIEGYAL